MSLIQFLSATTVLTIQVTSGSDLDCYLGQWIVRVSSHDPAVTNTLSIITIKEILKSLIEIDVTRGSHFNTSCRNTYN